MKLSKPFFSSNYTINILYIALFISSSPLYSNEYELSSNNIDKIEVVTEYLAPFQLKNEDGSLGGMSTEIVYALFDELNKKPNIKTMAWARAYDLAIRKENILIYSIARTLYREELFHWVGSISDQRLFFWGLKSKFKKSIGNIEQLKENLVVASRYSNVSKYLLDNNFNNIYLTVKDEQKMAMLYLNRVELLVATEQTVKWLVEKQSLDFAQIKKLIEVPKLSNNLNVALSLKTNQETVLLFRNAFIKIKQKGILNKIKQQWGITK